MLTNREKNILVNDHWHRWNTLLKTQIISAICVCFFLSSHGATFYVSTSGNNANNGLSSEKAWRTVKHAAMKAKAGDIVYIKAGLYKGESVDIKNSGTEKAPIIFQGYQNIPGDAPDPKYKPGDALNYNILPVIEGINGVFGVGIDKKSYIEIRNLGVTNSVYGISTYGAHHFKIENIYLDKIGFTSAAGEGITLYLSNHFTIRNCVVTDAGMVNYSMIRCADGLVENCKSYAVGYSKESTDYHIVLQDAQNITVQNCQAYNLHSLKGGHPGHGIGIKDTYKGGAYPYAHSSNNKIINCAAYDMGEYFFVAHEAFKNEFENCTAKGHYDNPSQNSWSEGINIRDGAHDNTFRKCRIEGVSTSLTFQNTEEGPTNTDGTVATQTCYNNTIANCKFVNSATGIEMWNADNNLITNCVFDGAGKSALVKFPYKIKNMGNICRNSVITNITGAFRLDNYNSDNKISFVYSNFWKNKFGMPKGGNNVSQDPKFFNMTKNDNLIKK